MLWDSTQVDLEVSHCSTNWILFFLRCRETWIKASIINIYIHVRYMEKVDCWNSLFVIKESLDLPSCITVGDFNTILYNLEKRGGSCVCNPIREKMEDLITDWDLQNINPIEGKYT
jgi:hypothetical protein